MPKLQNPIRISTATEDAIAEAEAAYRQHTSVELIPDDLRAKLIENGRNRDRAGYDPPPVVKLFTPDAGGTWLIIDADPDEPDRLFGLCDVGLGEPELGYISLSELQALRGPLGLPVERDLYFEADKSLSEYTEDARMKGRIDV